MANPKVQVGKTIFVSIEIRDQNEKVQSTAGTTWGSSNSAIASVGTSNAKGVVVNGVAPGTATITATNGADQGTIDIDVIAAPSAQVRKISLSAG
jgi:uncharacterized protein YjdB